MNDVVEFAPIKNVTLPPKHTRSKAKSPVIGQEKNNMHFSGKSRLRKLIRGLFSITFSTLKSPTANFVFAI